MTTTNKDSISVLRFWRDLEIFNIPTAPSSRDANSQTKITTLRRHDPSCNILPWRHTEFAPNDLFGYVHVVYLGVTDTEDLSRLLLKGLFPNHDLSERERQRLSGTGWLAALVVDELGFLKPDSYLPASFAHGVAALRETNTLDNINARLDRAKEEFKQRHHQLSKQPLKGASMDGKPCPTEGVMDWNGLDRRIQGRSATKMNPVMGG